MKCVHCSCSFERGAWFCPNCKRSSPKKGQSKRVPPRWEAVPSVALSALRGAAGRWRRWVRAEKPAPMRRTRRDNGVEGQDLAA